VIAAESLRFTKLPITVITIQEKRLRWMILFVSSVLFLSAAVFYRSWYFTEARLTEAEIVARLDSIAPWGTTTNYESSAWGRAIDAALVLQAADPRIVENALERFMRENRDSDPGESKPYIVLRLAFDLPENAPREAALSFKGWYRLDREASRFDADTNADGTINLAWPLSWKSGQPKIICGMTGSAGPSYAAAAEFRYMRERFPLRKLDAILSEAR